MNIEVTALTQSCVSPKTAADQRMPRKERVLIIYANNEVQEKGI